ncbi:ras and Rab interactor 2 isoform X2 [Scleropages formosus]|nr:ras and Rab interactor 2-like isoform X2 [Scleropages formosus]
MVRSSRKLMKKVVSLRMEDAAQEPVQDFPVQETKNTFSLEGSAIVFDDLVHMVAFYCASRDLLPFTLRLPEGIAAARTSADLQVAAKLGAGFWDSALCNPGAPTGDASQQDRQTPADPLRPALCFPHLQPPGSRPSAARLGATPSSRSLPSRLPPERGRMPEMVYWIRKAPDSGAPAPGAAALDPLTPPTGRRGQLSCQVSVESRIVKAMLERCQTKFRSVSCPEEGSSGAPYAALEETGQLSESDQRLSDVSMSTSSSSSVDFLCNYTKQSRAFGDSSVEDEEDEVENEEDDDDDEEEDDYPIRMEKLKAKKRRNAGPPMLSLSLRGPLRRMSGALDSLMAPERRAVRRVQRLARDRTSYFGCLVQDYVSFVQEEHRCHSSSLDLLQTLRQFLTQTKAYLAQSSELEPPIRSLVPEKHIDPVLEKAMHKCVLKPLKGTVLTALQEFQEKSGEWQQLKANLVQAKSKTPQELGADPAAAAPDPVTVEKIRHKFHTMFKMYSPEKKVSILLQICKIIYTIMEGSSVGERGADDFLPMLTYVLAQCDLPQLDLEIQYMMELLDPSQLQGEGGYYLTSAYAAMSLIRSIQEEQAEQVLRSQTRDTLKQWHRRRTAQRSTPVIEDLQNYLRVALQDPDCSCTAKTLQVPPFCTTRDVCQLCASKFQVRDPESHALFLLTEGGAQQLEPDTLPQMIKAEIHSHPDVLPFHFVYRPLDNLNLRE